ncbi:TetR/AcrR family transcriptional regulator [Microbacterium sp. NIBRBAC000506063]|uniref:TetR/AcrR family transcriptional regulator n=1 Tax=Microbacterium sp. NIBRBAC000506063 TaxID=2734618 RepID=UPI001CB714C7|nr:TetR/AcrR family transcriptional regulator [Microbacterium sp. NIBRBAC000506063]
MTTEHRAGRPRASSRETLAEAASELFLEQGYEATSVADITRRAGVSRSSFFNYFSSKSDVVWSGIDERISVFEHALAEGADVDAAVRAIVEDFAPDALALALMNAGAMHLDGELDRDSALRSARIARAVASREESRGQDALAAQVRGAAVGARFSQRSASGRRRVRGPPRCAPCWIAR